MAGVPIVATATSTGTGTDKTQLNGGAVLKLPDSIRAILAATPYILPSAALTAAQAVEQNFSIESSDVDGLDPEIFVGLGPIGGLGTFASAMSPILQAYDLNVATGKAPNLKIYGTSLTANTAAMLAGVELLITEGGPRGKPKHWINPEANTATGTAASRVKGKSYTFSNGMRITDIYAYAVPGVVTASDSVGGYMEFATADKKTPLELMMVVTPVITALGTAAAASMPAMSKRKVDFPVRANVTIQEYMNMEQALTAAGTFMSGLAYTR